jgi:hypothetical protein
MDARNGGLAAHPAGPAAAVTVGPDRQWNSWNAADPLAMVHLPTGLCLRFSAFSSAEGRYRLLGEGLGVSLLEHASDGHFIRARIATAGISSRTHIPSVPVCVC